MSYKIEKYQKFFINFIQRDTYTFHVIDNNCPNIEIGDDIEIDGINGKVEYIEWFMKSFDIKGDNVTILVKES
jgi:hypothetical protein